MRINPAHGELFPMTPIYLAGPTAVGKTEVSLLLAERLGGEIISVDSMQVYQGLDIGTAKASAADRSRIPHHLIDILPITETFSAADFLKAAQAAEAQIRARGNIPIYCGGTGLYFKAIAFGLGDSPPSDPKLREELQNTPLDQLLAELAQKDPACHREIDRQNPRRIIRALEVIRLTGKPFSSQKSDWRSQETAPAGIWLGLERPRLLLYQRIDARVDQMFQQGLIEETKAMIEHGLLHNSVAMQSIGYRQVADYLAGKASLPNTINLVKQKTRQFAKRQMTWFKRQLPMEWIEIEENQSTNIAQQLLKFLDQSS
ncbi:MAG: tRNA (adenosine(37)-N6)-dimethylallyltransferase MiaA [Verrucomicrobiales bacterium]